MKLLLQRYVASHFIGPFIGASIFAVAFLLIFQLFRITKWIVAKNIDWLVIAELVSHLIITFIPIAIPLASLFATVYAMRKLSEDSELMVMRSFGLDKNKILMPFLILGVLISLICYGLTSTVIPDSKRQFKKGFNKITSKAVLADIKPGQFFTQIPSVSLFAGQVEEKGTLLKDIFIEKLSKDSSKWQVIKASKGKLIKKQQDKWGVADIRLKLFNGSLIDYKGSKSSVNKVFFDTYEFPVFDSSRSRASSASVSMKSNQELRLYLSMSDEKRRKYISDRDFIRLKIEYWSRYSTALSCIVFIILGFSFGWASNRRKNKNSAKLCFFILAGYYILYFSGLSLAKKDILPASVVTILPSILCFLVALKYFRQLDWSD